MMPRRPNNLIDCSGIAPEDWNRATLPWTKIIAYQAPTAFVWQGACCFCAAVIAKIEELARPIGKEVKPNCCQRRIGTSLIGRSLFRGFRLCSNLVQPVANDR